MPDLRTENSETTEFETVKFRINGSTAEISMNRPHRLNAVVEQLYDEILAALELAEKNLTVRVIVLTGEGRAFCVGADLKEHKNNERSDFENRRYLIKANDVCRRLQTITKPVIAAVNGYALGAGAEMAVSSDFIVMQEDAQIGFPEISIGTFLGGGVTNLLPQLVGLAKARELIFTGDRIDGNEAVRIGLAAVSTSGETFESEVAEFADRIGGGAPLSMSLAKEHLNTSQSRDYETALVTELEGIRACMTTSDWREGVVAFSEKRKPKFTGN